MEWYARLQEHHYQALRHTYEWQIVEELGVSKSGVNDFLNAFEKCDALAFPLSEEITNYGIAELVFGKPTVGGGRHESFEPPDFPTIHS